MALTWEKLKAFGNIVKKTFAPTTVNCVYNERIIWINTATDPNTAYLINGLTITPLPVELSSSPLPSQATSISNLEDRLDAIESDYMKKSVYDTDADGVVDEAEAIDGGAF